MSIFALPRDQKKKALALAFREFFIEPSALTASVATHVATMSLRPDRGLVWSEVEEAFKAQFGGDFDKEEHSALIEKIKAEAKLKTYVVKVYLDNELQTTEEVTASNSREAEKLWVQSMDTHPNFYEPTYFPDGVYFAYRITAELKFK